MGLGSFPMDSPYYVGMLGSHGHNYACDIMKGADLLVIVGARMSDRAIHNFGTLDPETDVVHIDIDPAEIGKIFTHNIPVVGDAKNILKKMGEKIVPLDTAEWMKKN